MIHETADSHLHQQKEIMGYLLINHRTIVASVLLLLTLTSSWYLPPSSQNYYVPTLPKFIFWQGSPIPFFLILNLPLEAGC